MTSARSAGVAILAVTALIALRAPAPAGEYHYGATLVCNECHVLHSSTGGLNAPTANAVCLNCHDGRAGIPDVKGDDVNATPGNRQGGALTTGVPLYQDWKGHTLDSVGPPPGGTWSAGETSLRCVGCHAKHGNTNYRNLRSSVPITYVTSTVPSNTTDVRIGLAQVPPVGSRISGGFYSSTNIFFNAVSLTSGYSAFCAGCHGNLNANGGTSPHRRHPTDGTGFLPTYVSQYNSMANKVQVLFANNAPGVFYDSTTRVSCMSCHKAHGNRNPFALIYMKRTGAVTEEGVDGATLTDLCGQCHAAN